MHMEPDLEGQVEIRGGELGGVVFFFFFEYETWGENKKKKKKRAPEGPVRAEQLAGEVSWPELPSTRPLPKNHQGKHFQVDYQRNQKATRRHDP